MHPCKKPNFPDSQFHCHLKNYPPCRWLWDRNKRIHAKPLAQSRTAQQNISSYYYWLGLHNATIMPHLYDIGPHKVLSLIFHSQRCHEVGRLRSRLWSLVVKNTDFLIWAWVWILTLFNLICKTVSTVVSTFLHCMAESVEWDTNTWKAFGTMPTRDKCPETMDMMIFKGVCFPNYVLTVNTRRWNSLLSNRWFINKEVKESGVRPGCGCNLDHSFAPVALEVHPPHPNVLLPWLPRDQKEHTNARAAGK